MKRSLLGDLLSQSAPIAETWLSRLDAGLRQTQTALEAALGTNGQSDTAPLSGPRSVDEATAELANRMLRLLRRAPRNLSAMPTLGSDLLDAVQQSFPFRDPARWLGLPLQLPIACASLISQEALRGAAVAQFMPAHKLPEFLDFVVETFSDLHVYFSLQYREELAYWQERVQEDPEDHAARWTLGRTYTKCGLFAEAADELASAANAQEWRQRALYECMVALYHAGDYRGAIAAGVPSLELAPEHQPTRYWLWLAAQKTGGYPESVAPALRMEARDGHHPTDVRLQDVAARIGLDKTSGGRGSAIIDHDGNGYLDVVFAGAHAGCSLYRNNGEEAPGTFTDISTGSGLDSCVYGFAIAAGDYNNDGLPDLYISSLGFYNGQGRLMRNNGDGTFTDITIQAGLETWGPGFTATWVDFDGDGWLDLYLANNLGGMFDRKTPNRLFHNNRDGTFTDITRDAGIDTPWTSIGATWGDFRNCGRPDLFVSSLGRAQLFRNNGDGTFADVSREAGIDAPTNGSACLVCDIDNDGWLDIVQFTYSRPDDAISTLRDGRGPIDGSPMRIFRNNRDGTFTNVAAQLGITGCWGTMSANAGDFDNDGNLDFFLGNGDPAMDRTEAAVLLANDGRGIYRNVSFTAGLPHTGKGHGINMADLAGDGRLHLIVANGGLYPGDLQTNAVYRPEEVPGNYLNLRLRGTVSNRDAIGARLELLAGGRSQHRLVSGGSYFGCLPLEQHFGLGTTTSVEAVEISWPSGARQRIEKLPANTTLVITEGQDDWEEVYR